MAKPAEHHFDWLDQQVEKLRGGHFEETVGTKSLGDALSMALTARRRENPAWYGVKLVQALLPRAQWELGQQGGVKKYTYALRKHQGNELLKSVYARELEAGGELLTTRIPEPEKVVEAAAAEGAKRFRQEKEWQVEGCFGELMPFPVEHATATAKKTAEEHWCEIVHEHTIRRFGEAEVQRMCEFLQNRGFTAPFEKARDWEPKKKESITRETALRMIEESKGKNNPSNIPNAYPLDPSEGGE